MLNTKSRLNCLLLILVFFLVTTFVFLDTDYAWLVAVGRKILENGITQDSQLFVLEGFELPIQQWGYCVILAFLDSLGLWAVGLFCLLQAVLVVFCIYKFSQVYLDSKIALLIALLAVFRAPYFGNVRPEMLSLILLILQLILQEKYVKTEQLRYLAFLPLIMIIEANFHAALCIMHVLLFIPYCLPIFKFVTSDYKSAFRYTKRGTIALGITFISMLLAMLVQPYGVDLVLYVFDFFRAPVAESVGSSELKPISLTISHEFVYWVASFGLFLFVIFKRKPSARYIYLCTGLLLLPVVSSALKPVQFLPLVIMYSLCYVFNTEAVMQFLNTSVHKVSYVVCLIFLVLFGTLGSLKLAGIITNSVTFDTIDDFDIEVSNLIADKHAHIFAHFNKSGVMEYLGYDRLVIDPRPESFYRNLTDERNPLLDYAKYMERDAVYLCDDDDGCLLYDNACNIADFKSFMLFYDIDFVIAPVGSQFWLSVIDMQTIDCEVAVFKDNYMLLRIIK